nr:MAG TPA: hypothetical protein [Caudoviricetes sp.]
MPLIYSKARRIRRNGCSGVRFPARQQRTKNRG